MSEKSLTIKVYMDAATFRSFALFEGFTRQKRWRPLAVFAGILLASAAVCFFMLAQQPQAMLPAVVLTLVALGLPIVYWFSFLSSVKQQSQKMRLDVPRYAYTLVLSAAEGIDVESGQERLHCPWEEVLSVYHGKGCTYLYLSHTKAYLLPDAQVPQGAEALWQLLRSKVPAERLHP